MAMGRIEHTLLDEGRGFLPNRPKTIARYHTIPQNVTTVSIYARGSEPSSLESAPTLGEKPVGRARGAKVCHPKRRARPTGIAHGRTTDAPEQRFNGANLRETLEVG